GNVGIGSVTPGQSLDVNGTVRMTGFNLNSSTGAGYILTDVSGTGAGTWQAAAAGGTNFWINDGGNVGISTIYAVGIGTTFVGGAGEASFAVMNGNVGIGAWLPAVICQVGKLS